MKIECQYKDGEWILYDFNRTNLINECFRKDEDRPVKIRTKCALSTSELAYLTKYVDFRSGHKIIQE